jgi:hypothetical protein
MTTEVTLASVIEAKLVATEQYNNHELVRAAFARKVLVELVPFLPHTLSRFFEVDGVGTGWGWPPETGKVTLMFKTPDGLPADDAPRAFGTIIKVAGALMGAGWTVDPTPKIEATQFAHALDVEVHGKRGPTQIGVQFSHLPESERCKLVEEQVYVAAKYETKLRVVCEGQPVRLTSGVEALPAGEAAS